MTNQGYEINDQMAADAYQTIKTAAPASLRACDYCHKPLTIHVFSRKKICPFTLKDPKATPCPLVCPHNKFEEKKDG